MHASLVHPEKPAEGASGPTNSISLVKSKGSTQAEPATQGGSLQTQAGVQGTVVEGSLALARANAEKENPFRAKSSV